MKAALALTLLTLAAKPSPADDPVEDVAAFFLERCDGVKGAQRATCDAAVQKNRAKISAQSYASKIELARLPPGSMAVKTDAAGGRLELDLFLAAAEMSEAQEACLSLTGPGESGRYAMAVPIPDGTQLERWKRRITDLLGRKPRPMLWLDLVYRVTAEGKARGKRCATGEALGLRILDGESGEVLAQRLEPAGEGAFEPRRLHPALQGVKGKKDSLEDYLSQVRERVSRRFAMVGGSKKSEANARLYIAENGTLLKAQVDPSGDSTFDRAVEDALRKASPLPAPPKDLQRRLKEQGVVLQFKR